MHSTRPLYWLSREYHDVMRLCRVGYMALQIGVNHVSGNWGKGPTDRSAYSLLAPHSDYPVPNEKGELPLGSFLLAAEFEVPDLEPTVVPVPMMRRHDLVSWWEKLLRPDDMSKEAFSIAMSQPAELIRIGYLMLHGPYYFEPNCGREYGACLSMVGAGTVALICSRPCSLCKFRRAVYASDRCDLCSMSKSVVTLGQYDQQAATTRKRKRVLQAGNSTLGELVAPHSQEPAERALALMVASMHRRTPEYRAWARAVRKSLHLAPGVSRQLPENFSRLRQQEQLRELGRVIDPREFDYAIWPEKILAAQRWMEVEATVASRRKVAGPTQSTIEKGRRARTLLSTGLSRSETATQMGLSLSHLSHILRRTEGLPDSG